MSTELNEVLFVIGQRFKSERERLGFTQAELGNKLESTSRTIGKYESGETEARVSQLIEFMKLGADLNYIFTGSRVPLTTRQELAPYNVGEVNTLLNAYTHANNEGKAALMAVVTLIKSKE